MSFITTGLRELTLKVRRQRTRLALRHEQRLLKKSEIALGREGTSEASEFPEVRNEIVALRKLEQEQKEFAVRIAKIEEALKQIDQQRQENSREQSAALARLEEEKRPLVETRNAAKATAELCSKELGTVDRRMRENEAADQALLKQLSSLQATDPPPPDREARMERIAEERARLPNEKAEMVQARLGRATACEGAGEKLAAAEAEVAQADKNITRVRGEFEARDRALNESSRAQQEEVRAARQRHQTVEEKKNPAYLNIGRHLANAGIAPPNAPHLLADAQRHRAAVGTHQAQTGALDELSGKIDKQELRKFYFTVVSILVLLAIVLPLASQSPSKRDWLPQDTVAIFALHPGQLTHNVLVEGWRKEHPEVWKNVFAGLVGPALRAPGVDLARDVSRITRALTFDDRSRPQDYVLVETRGEIGPALRAITDDKTFSKSTVSGLVVWQRPDVSAARVGPRTLAVGSLGSVDQLVQVRLGMQPDLKPEDPLFAQFQTLDPDSTLRLVARRPRDLQLLFGPIFPEELLEGGELIGFAVTVGAPTKAHLFLRMADAARAKELAAQLEKDANSLLTLPNSDFVLCQEAPKVETSKADVDLHFEVPAGAARLLLQRLGKVSPAAGP